MASRLAWTNRGDLFRELVAEYNLHVGIDGALIERNLCRICDDKFPTLYPPESLTFMAISESPISGAGISHSADAFLWKPSLPSLLLQVVVTLGEKTDEGHIIEAVAPAWFEIAKLVASDPSAIYQIGYQKWEDMIAAWYKAYGFDEVTLTPRSGDLGRDVIAVKKGEIGRAHV